MTLILILLMNKKRTKDIAENVEDACFINKLINSIF